MEHIISLIALNFPDWDTRHVFVLFTYLCNVAHESFLGHELGRHSACIDRGPQLIASNHNTIGWSG